MVCHNRISGFGDPVVNEQVESRAWDVYGNDILDAFDGTEWTKPQKMCACIEIGSPM